ncbi:hypothetical protein WJX81_007074 [Elliptochloris bilobata]|uniref:Uncharacterized protein n=1 Tax=Elliptochloris bilobata TaxID=381761 RepID=A0AAW1QY42_9CHLO
MAGCIAKAPVLTPPAAVKATRVAPMAVTSRRVALSAALLSGLSLVAVEKASAISIPSQESTPGNKGGLSAASASAYTLEGIKKHGISGSQRKKLLAAVPRAPLAK